MHCNLREFTVLLSAFVCPSSRQGNRVKIVEEVQYLTEDSMMWS